MEAVTRIHAVVGPLLVVVLTAIALVVAVIAWCSAELPRAADLARRVLLGIVVGWLDDRRPRLRAFLGTGILGGFTTYSAFAVQVAQLTGEVPVLGLLLAAVSIFAGVLAAAVGLRIGRTIMDVPGEVEPVEDAE